MKAKHIKADEIRALRKALSMTQEEFGRLIGVTKRYVAYCEAGEKVFSDSLLMLLELQTKRLSASRKIDCLPHNSKSIRKARKS